MHEENKIHIFQLIYPSVSARLQWRTETEIDQSEDNTGKQKRNQSGKKKLTKWTY